MTSAKQFFSENIKLLPDPKSPRATTADLREYNLNSGLLVLAKQLEDLQTEVLRQIRNLEGDVRRLR